MTNTYENKVGLEAEFLLRKGEELVYPSEYGFSTDDFLILGEFRADPGLTKEECLANFMKAYYQVVSKAEKAKLTVDISGYTTITNKKLIEIKRKMGHKDISACENIYGTDILELSDTLVEDGKIVGHNISCGLHVHFTSQDDAKTELKTDSYTKIAFPEFMLGKQAISFGDLYKKDAKQIETIVKASANRITKPVIQYLVKGMDDALFDEFKPEISLKFRQPGFYEKKSHGGFEYRSLPFSIKVLDNIYKVVDTAFSLLESI